MNPADDFTAPLGQNSASGATTGYVPHPLAAQLINTPKSETLASTLTPIRPIPDTPEIQAGVQDLTAMFAASLTTQEVQFHTPEVAKAPGRDPNAPLNFKNAYMAIIDAMLLNPGISMTALSGLTGYSRNWLHKITSSDAFQAKLSERQKCIIDPLIHAAIKDRINGLVSRSLEVLEERMESEKIPLDAALEVFNSVSKAAGIGVKDKTPIVAQQFIVHVPPRMADASAWAQMHSGQPPAVLAEPLDITPATPDPSTPSSETPDAAQ